MSASRTTAAALLCFALAIAGTRSAHADDEAAVTIEVTGESTSLQELLRMAGDKLGLQFVWSGHEKALMSPIQGQPAFRGSKSDVFGSIRTLLLTYDLVLVPISPEQKRSIFRVVDMRRSSFGASLRAEPIVLNEENLATFEKQPWRFVTTTLRLEHAVELRNMRTALSKLVTGSAIGQVTEVPDARVLMITDFAPKVVAAYRMIRSMDVKPPAPTSGPRMTVVKIEHARAHDLAQLITSLLGKPAPKGQPASGRPRVVADMRTNQIVLSGDAGPVSQIEEMIKQLDVEGIPRKVMPPRAPVTARVVRLEFMQGVDAAQALTAFVRGASELFDTRPTVVSLRSTNALVIAGTERAHKILGELIQQLDEAPGEKDEKK